MTRTQITTQTAQYQYYAFNSYDRHSYEEEYYMPKSFPCICIINEELIKHNPSFYDVMIIYPDDFGTTEVRKLKLKNLFKN